ncbi:hypothetical protein B0J11DRAFT_513200 [Dendryphion nanum]|uniref:Small secreted protein n=1 Tax=Dendryphion nanum TaxID=256645 RepID=A0A9P9EGQ4_9PLEO|nr:hypothetical protein B0J11DRAFT_513200 [Dendryphion nanum]
MRAFTSTLLLATFTITQAWNITLHSAQDCLGAPKTLGNLKLEDGCHKLSSIAKDSKSLTPDWSEDLDNEYVLMTFSDVNCCNGASGALISWRTDCVNLAMYQSIRVVDPKDINKGKKGDKYDCRGSEL